VDPDSGFRSLLVEELRQEGFACDALADGWTALSRLEEQPYAALITELAVPVVHGYALIRYLLGKPWRPAILVSTRVCEPRLVRHLMELGIEDVLLRPHTPAALSAKLRMTLQRPEAQRLSAARSVRQQNARRLAEVLRSVPVRQSVRALWGEWSQSGVTASLSDYLEKDSRLKRTLLSLANNTFFNSRGQWIKDAQAACRHLGAARSVELLLAADTLCSLLEKIPAWLKADRVAWHGLAAAMLADLFLRATGRRDEGAGVVTAAMLAEAGRILLAQAFPERYPDLLQIAAHTKLPLEQVELKELGFDGPAAMARFLRESGVELPVGDALGRVCWRWEDLRELPAEVRNVVDWIKASRFLAKVATYDWNAWDIVEPPPSETLSLLNLPSVHLLVRTVEKCAVQWRWDQPEPQPQGAHGPTPTLAPPIRRRAIAYRSLNDPTVDAVPALLHSLGWQTLDGASQPESSSTVLTYVPVDEPDVSVLEHQKLEDYRGKLVILRCDSKHGSAIALPCSVARLQEWLDQLVPIPTPWTTPPGSSFHGYATPDGQNLASG